MPLASLNRSAMPDWPVAPASMGLAAMMIGLGVGVAADRWLRTNHSATAAIRLSPCVVVTSLWLMCVFPGVEIVILTSLFAGLGVASEWSALADACRGELTARTRWAGIRIWTAAFPMGMAAALLAHWRTSAASIAPASIVVAGLATLTAAWLWTRSFRFVRDPAPVTAEQLAAEVAVLEAARDDGDSKATQNETEENGCDATDCCGGSKPATPTRFSQGVILVAVGWVILLVSLQVVFDFEGSVFQRLILALSVPLGSFLMFSTAPRTGYAVALLPFFLALVVSLLTPFFAVEWSLHSTILLVLAASALHTGLRLVIGESFADCSSDPVRTRVHVVALFAAAAVLLIESSLRRLMPDGFWQVIPLLMVIVVGISTLRTLPSPVVSSLGEDDPDSPDADELQDVMAIVNEQI